MRANVSENSRSRSNELLPPRLRPSLLAFFSVIIDFIHLFSVQATRKMSYTKESQQTYLLIHSDPLISELRKKHSKISDDDHFLSEAVELLKINGDNELLPDDY